MYWLPQRSRARWASALSAWEAPAWRVPTPARLSQRIRDSAAATSTASPGHRAQEARDGTPARGRAPGTATGTALTATGTTTTRTGTSATGAGGGGAPANGGGG